MLCSTCCARHYCSGSRERVVCAIGRWQSHDVASRHVSIEHLALVSITPFKVTRNLWSKPVITNRLFCVADSMGWVITFLTAHQHIQGHSVPFMNGIC